MTSDRLQVACAAFIIMHELVENVNKKKKGNLRWWIPNMYKNNTDRNLINNMQFDENCLHFQNFTRTSFERF